VVVVVVSARGLVSVGNASSDFSSIRSCLNLEEVNGVSSAVKYVKS